MCACMRVCVRAAYKHDCICMFILQIDENEQKKEEAMQEAMKKLELAQQMQRMVKHQCWSKMYCHCIILYAAHDGGQQILGHRVCEQQRWSGIHF